MRKIRLCEVDERGKITKVFNRAWYHNRYRFGSSDVQMLLSNVEMLCHSNVAYEHRDVFQTNYGIEVLR